MAKMVLFVLNNPSRLADLLAAWKAAGVRGATAVQGVGLGRALGYLQDDVPLFLSPGSLDESQEAFVRIIFAVVDEQVDLDRLLEQTEAVVGDLDQPNTGIFLVLPVDSAVGLFQSPRRNRRR